MINASELRIGNLIRGTDGLQERVLEIHIDSECSINYESPSWYEYMPLDNLWLERFGFINTTPYEWDFNGWCFQYFGSSFHYSAGEGLKLSEPIQYVHQLQNLYFALTGQELILKPRDNRLIS